MLKNKELSCITFLYAVRHSLKVTGATRGFGNPLLIMAIAKSNKISPPTANAADAGLVMANATPNTTRVAPMLIKAAKDRS